MVIPAVAFSVSILYAIVKNQSGTVNNYASNRGFLHPKNVDFVFRNIVFVLLMLSTSVLNFWNGGPLEKTLLLAVWGSIIAQRTFVFYFWQGPLLTNLLLTVQSDWIENVPLSGLWTFNALAFLFLILPMIWNTTSIYPDGHIRRFYTRARNRKAQIEIEEKQVSWLKENVSQHETVYLWGSQVSLLLQAQLVHIPDTFYNHNHLFYWSNIKDKVGYAVDVIRKHKPDFIIEAAVIENEQFPAREFTDSYTLYKEFEAMKVYRRVAE